MVTGLGWYDRAQWEKLTQVVENRSELDDTYEQWESGAVNFLQKMEREGRKIAKVFVDVDALVAWCRNRGLPVNAESRAEYIMLVLRRSHGPRPNGTPNPDARPASRHVLAAVVPRRLA